MGVTNWTSIVEGQTGQVVSDKYDSAFENIDDEFVSVDSKLADIANKNALHGVTNPDIVILSININPTKYEIVPFTYYIQGLEYAYAGSTESSGFGQAGDFITIGMDASGLVTKINSFFTPYELKTILEIGAIASSDGTNITAIGDSVFFSDEYMENLYIRFKSFEGTSFWDGVARPSINATNANTFDIKGGNISTPDMLTITIAAEVQAAGNPIYNIAGNIAIRPQQAPLVANNTQYDNGVDLVAIPTGHYVQHTLFRSSRTGAYYLQYGQNTYTRQNDAIQQDPIDTLFNIQGSEVETLAKVIVQEGALGIVGLVDIRGTRNEVLGILPQQANKVELGALSFSNQEPSVLNSPLQIEFGGVQVTDNIDIAVDGTITFKTTNNYTIELALHVGRNTGGGEAFLFIRSLKNDIQYGHTTFNEIDGEKDKHPYTSTVSGFFETGDTYKIEIYRDSAGDNDGGLYTQVSALGWTDAPSACIIIRSQD